MASEKEQVAITSMAASAGLTIAKAIVGVASGSLAILSEAAHSLIDFVATVMTYFAVRIADRPADDEHHYGHGKIESISALAETALLFGLSFYVVYEGSAPPARGRRARHRSLAHCFPGDDRFGGRGFLPGARALPGRWRDQQRGARSRRPALQFGHVVVGRGAARAWRVALGYPWMDSVAAIVVAVFICIAGWRLGTRTIGTLTDTAPSGVADRSAKLSGAIPGVVTLERVRVRRVGPTSFIELVVGTSRALPLDRVAALKDEIVRKVRTDVGGAEVSVTVDPLALDNETVAERVMVIARNRALGGSPRHRPFVGWGSVCITRSRGRWKPLARRTLTKLHRGSSWRSWTNSVTMWKSILTSNLCKSMRWQARTPRNHASRKLPRRCRKSPRLTAFSRRSMKFACATPAEGEIVNFHCYTDPAVSVHVVHERVDEVERGLRRRFPAIKRVVSHAEPRGT